MIKSCVYAVSLMLLITGCGMTRGQKAQIAAFAAATSEAVDASSEQIINMRNQVIEIRKERIIMGDLPVTDKVDLDITLKAEKVAMQVAVLKLLEDYANSLNALATNDQSEAISKAAMHLSASVDAVANAYKSDTSKVILSDEQKKAAAGIASTIGGWYIEWQKKNATKEIVEKYAPLVTKLSEIIEQDLSLIGNSACWPQFRSGAAADAKPVNNKTKSGTLDIFCTQADSLREHSLKLLRCPAVYIKNHEPPYPPICATVTFQVRERALSDYLKMNLDMDNVASFSSKAAELIPKMLAANNQLLKVLEDEKFTAEDVKEQVAAMQELVTTVRVLAGPRKE
jgi:hypothetical protein